MATKQEYVILLGFIKIKMLLRVVPDMSEGRISESIYSREQPCCGSICGLIEGGLRLFGLGQVKVSESRQELCRS